MSSVADFGNVLVDAACPACGAEAYLHAFGDGQMVVRWRCGHVRWEIEPKIEIPEHDSYGNATVLGLDDRTFVVRTSGPGWVVVEEF